MVAMTQRSTLWCPALPFGGQIYHLKLKVTFLCDNTLRGAQPRQLGSSRNLHRRLWEWFYPWTMVIVVVGEDD
ncbi:hypothetical protein Hanom_Chr07g00624931 [Helianthus anomalus]